MSNIYRHQKSFKEQLIDEFNLASKDRDDKENFIKNENLYDDILLEIDLLESLIKSDNIEIVIKKLRPYNPKIITKNNVGQYNINIKITTPKYFLRLFKYNSVQFYNLFHLSIYFNIDSNEYEFSLNEFVPSNKNPTRKTTIEEFRSEMKKYIRSDSFYKFIKKFGITL